MRQVASDLQPFFGALEIRVLEALWAADGAQSVRDLQPQFSSIAYTTLMTTLDRLHRKGVLSREKAGRAFVYRTRATRADLVAELAGDALGAAFGGRADELRPILSFFVETVSREDHESLAALEQLVAERRKAMKAEEQS